MREYLAHSGRKKPPVPPQKYADHVFNVLRRVDENVSSLVMYYRGDVTFFRETVRAAALFHDLGKLDEQFQRILTTNAKEATPNHVDAGTGYLIERNLVEAAFLVYAHHIGLQSIPEERAKAELFLRDADLFEQTNRRLQEFKSRHDSCSLPDVPDGRHLQSDWTGLTRRIALSCLVDADHGDTAANYRKVLPTSRPAPRWKERLVALDKYVQDLQSQEGEGERSSLLRDIYQSCRDADTGPSFYTCDSPVGTGKTTAVMAHLLRTAINKKLRHVIVVLPYTNIIKQTVDVYRKALVLPGENPHEVVAEHHHQADFEAEDTRHVATLWQSPIIVTTAVQFFETIASNYPSRLRKLHELPRSGVFIDETHAAIPNSLWPQTWRWLMELAEAWKCHFVLASGSLPRFWELRDMIDVPEKLPDLVNQKLRKRALRYEQKRVHAIRHRDVLDIPGLERLIASTPGPRLVIMNTVQSAAVIADYLAKKYYGENYSINIDASSVLHLSTSLTPEDREVIVEAVKRRLALSFGHSGRDFTLVATSCVEAGLDFSFRSAFRERASTSSLIQIGGRVRRRNEDFEPMLIDFKIEDEFINRHPAFSLSSQILEKLFDEGRIGTDSPSDLVTEALRRELMSDTNAKYELIKQKETDGDYPEVAKLYKVISENTRLVVVDPRLIKKLEEGENVSSRELNRKSVQIWTDKLTKTCAFPIEGFPGIFGWPEEDYDKVFLGYMKGMLQLLKTESEGGGVI